MLDYLTWDKKTTGKKSRRIVRISLTQWALSESEIKDTWIFSNSMRKYGSECINLTGHIEGKKCNEKQWITYLTSLGEWIAKCGAGGWAMGEMLQRIRRDSKLWRSVIPHIQNGRVTEKKWQKEVSWLNIWAYVVVKIVATFLTCTRDLCTVWIINRTCLILDFFSIWGL